MHLQMGSTYMWLTLYTAIHVVGSSAHWSLSKNMPIDSPFANFVKMKDYPPDVVNIHTVCNNFVFDWQLKWCAWAAVYCAFISFANTRSSEDTKQMLSSFM